MSDDATTPNLGASYVSDDQFIRQIALVRRIRTFLMEQGVAPASSSQMEASPFDLLELNLIMYRSSAGPATYLQWQMLENRQSQLQRLFTPDLQRRFRLQTVQRLIIIIPVFLLLLAGSALAMAIFPPSLALDGFSGTDPTAGWVFGGYLAWTACLGALGALGFLAVNSLSIQRDATFDLSDRGLVILRIVLGGLFGTIISLPFCFSYFKEFALFVNPTGHSLPVSTLSKVPVEGARGILLLVPFLLGFSTSLVMAILNRMIKGLETTFGIESGTVEGISGAVAGLSANVGPRKHPSPPATPSPPS
ncbi:MAG TPA: hypothetical protein VII63_00050 [Caulobacteraceae bacterium]